MAKLFRCDRCKDICEKTFLIKYDSWFHITYYFRDSEKEICIKCYKELIDWLDNRELIFQKNIVAYNPKDKTYKKVN